MKFKYAKRYLQKGDIVEVDLDNDANVRMMNRENFDKYQEGESFFRYGGWVTRSPVHIRVPKTGNWYIVVDLDGKPGHVNFYITIL
jgi:hypothetical protein